jgi:lipopolysaccharide biosynthesis regulator YciM
LGISFRRRGEVDRAIRLHQGLVQRPDLNDQQKVQALLALGEDYMRSGLLDRAETVFGDLAKLDDRAPQALRHLIGIYQAERDWQQAIDKASRYEAVTGESMGKLIAQFECELAERHRVAGDSEPGACAPSRGPMPLIRHTVRAGMLEGRIEYDAARYPAARSAPYERAARHDPDYLPDILPSLSVCYERVGDPTGARNFLTEMCEHYRGIAPVLALTRLVEAGEGVHAARDYLGAAAEGSPVGARRSGADRSEPSPTPKWTDPSRPSTISSTSPNSCWCAIPAIAAPVAASAHAAITGNARAARHGAR